jgi:serine protease Do
MKKYHICDIGIIVLLVSLFFIFPVESQDNGIKSLRQSSKAFASVARNVLPSVVFIQVEGSKRHSLNPKFNMPFDDEWPFGADLFRRFFGENQKPRRQPNIVGRGSGFIFASK